MPLSPYTTTTFASYLFGQISITLRGILGFSAATDNAFVEMVNDTLLVFKADDFTTLTTSKALQQVRATGRVYLWRTALQLLPTQYDISVDGSSFKRSQILQAIQLNLTMAENEAQSLGVDLPSMAAVHVPNASLVAVTHNHDPYNTRTVYGVD